MAVNPAHHLNIARRLDRLTFMDVGFFRSLRSILARSKDIHSQIFIDNRRLLPAPAWRAGKWRFPDQFSCSRIETTHVGFLHPRLWDKQTFLIVKGPRKGNVHTGPVPPP